MKRFEFIGESADGDRQHELREALRAINSTIGKCEKVELKLKDGSPQKTLTVRRIKALRIAVELISKELGNLNE